MGEAAEHRLKRLGMRSWRRGTKEMDLILGPYADAHLATMDEAVLQQYEALLAENDQDLIGWMLGSGPPPPAFAPLVAEISAFARTRLPRKI